MYEQKEKEIMNERRKFGIACKRRFCLDESFLFTFHDCLGAESIEFLIYMFTLISCSFYILQTSTKLTKIEKSVH